MDTLGGKCICKYDGLTGLYNKCHFFDLLDSKISEYNLDKGGRRKLVIALVSLNEYYEIRNALGYLIADNILKGFSARLSVRIQPQDILARYNEVKFAILIPNVEGFEKTIEIMRTTMKGINPYFSVGDQDLKISTNLGIVTYPDDGKDIITLMRNADMALAKAKILSTNTAFKFEKYLDNEAQEYFWMKNDLFRVVELDELIINYQPIYDTSSNKLVGTEALVRWDHSKKGIIPPLEFIPIAEKSGMIYPIGEWVLLNACNQNKRWQDLGYEPIYISINVSVLQLEQPDFYDKIKAVLEESEMDPKYLHLEITETYFAQNYELISNNIDKINELGVAFSIDDFGTGYSSLGQLSELDINTIKIDRSFIDGVDSNTNNNKIVRAVISLAKSLNIGLTAEGVERPEELKFLKENKCNIVQGFLFSKPVEASQIEKLLNISKALVN